MSDAPAWFSGSITGATFLLVASQFSLESRRRHRADVMAQAETISAWFSGEGSRVDLSNSSGDPVYNVVVNFVLLYGGGPTRGEDLPADDMSWRHFFPVLPPGRYATEFEPGWAGMHRWPAAEIAFTDRSEHHWLRRSTGNLERIRKDPRLHYGMSLPASVSVLDRPPGS